MNNRRTLSGIDSDSIRHLSLPSSTAALLIGGDSGTNGQVLTKNEDTNKLEWDDIERRNIAPNSIDGSRLTKDISFGTSGNIRLSNGTDNAKLTCDKFEYQHGFIGFGDFTMGNQNGSQDIIKYTELDGNGATIDTLVIRNTDNQVVGNLQVDDDSSTNRLKITGADGNLTTTGTLFSTKAIANNVFGLDITGNARIIGKLEVDGGIDIGNLDVFGNVKMRRLDGDSVYWFNYQEGTNTTGEDFDITLHNVMSINDAGSSGNIINFITATGEINTTGKIVSTLSNVVGLSITGKSQLKNDVVVETDLFVENKLFLQTDDTLNTTRKIELDATTGNIHQYESFIDANNNNEYFSVKNGIVAMRGATLGGTGGSENKLTFTNGGLFETETTALDGTTTTHFTLNGLDGSITQVKSIDGFGGLWRNQGNIYAYNTLDQNNPDFYAWLQGSTGQIFAISNVGVNSLDVNRSIKCGKKGGSVGNVLLGFETDGDLLLNESSTDAGSHIRTDKNLNIHGLIYIIPTPTSDNVFPIALFQTETDSTNGFLPSITFECDFRINHTAADGALTNKVFINVDENNAVSTFYDELRVNRVVSSTDTNFFNVDTANSRAYINNTLFIENDLIIGKNKYAGSTYLQALTSDLNTEHRRLLQGFGENTSGNELPTWSIQGNIIDNSQGANGDGKSLMSLDQIWIKGNSNKDSSGDEDRYSFIQGNVNIQPIDGDGRGGGDPNTGMFFTTQTTNGTLGSTTISLKGNAKDDKSGTKGISVFSGATLFDVIDGGGAVGFGANDILNNCDITIKDTDKADHSGGIVFENAKSGINGFPNAQTKCFNLDLTDTSNAIPTAIIDPHDSLCRLAPTSETIFPDKDFPPNQGHRWYNWNMQFKTGEDGASEGNGLIDDRWFITIPSSAIPSNKKMKVGLSIYMEECAFGSINSTGNAGNLDAYYRWNYIENPSSPPDFSNEVAFSSKFMVSGLGNTLNPNATPISINNTKRSRGGSMLIQEDIIELPNNTSSYVVFPRFSNRPQGNNGRAKFQFRYGATRADALLWSHPTPQNFTDIT